MDLKYDMEEQLDWLRGHCNRFVNGHCKTLSCLTRGGGYVPGNTLKRDYDKSTCIPYEILQQLHKDVLQHLHKVINE